MTMLEKVLNSGFDGLKTRVENIVLRPNDSLKLMGQERFNSLVDAVEIALEEHYKDNELYTYYYFMKEYKNKGFWTFNRREWRNAYESKNNQ